MLPLSYSMKNYEACVRLLCYMFFSLLCWNWPYTTFIDALSGVDHLTFEGGGGGVILKKKIPARACQKKKVHPAKME